MAAREFTKTYFDFDGTTRPENQYRTGKNDMFSEHSFLETLLKPVIYRTHELTVDF